MVSRSHGLTLTLEPASRQWARQRRRHVTRAEAGYRFSALYDKISREDILAHAYAQCRSNKGAPGVDGQISRIRLSDKTSRLHPRHVVPKPAQAYEPEVPVKVREWISSALAPPDLVLEAFGGAGSPITDFLTVRQKPFAVQSSHEGSFDTQATEIISS
jgi:hypothetical protein